VDVDTHIDREVAAALAVSPIRSFDMATMELTALPELRASMAEVARQAAPPLPPGVTQREEVVAGKGGAPDTRVCVYSGTGAATGRGGILWIHGGGYMVGSGLMTDARLARWADELDAVVVSVEYRLAPEHPYPSGLDDCYAALAWMYGHAAELGVDPARIGVVGPSAGGGLAAALALLARDRGELPLAFQLLIYPMIDDRNVTPSSRLDTLVWTREANQVGWRAYLGDAAGGDVPPYAAPARATDLAGLPPAFVSVGTLDVFRDEDIDYALRLLAAGVPTELHVYPGATHGFETLCPDAAVSRRCQRDIDDALARALAAT
jgi:acetyl esterase/lipase